LTLPIAIEQGLCRIEKLNLRNINTLYRIKQRTNKVYRHMTNNTKIYSIFNWKTVALNKTAENGFNGVLIQYY
jgi:hypothetical protein